MNEVHSARDWKAKVEWEGGIYEMFHYGGRDIVDEYDLPEPERAEYKAAYEDHAKHCGFCKGEELTHDQPDR